MGTMTAPQLIMKEILESLRESIETEGGSIPELTPDNVCSVFEQFEQCEFSDWIQDAKSDFRGSGVDTEIPCNWSRHYESKSVARQMPAGQWVGWTYWYGGGKHGEPEAIDWLSGAYLLNVTEEQKTVTVRTFTKAALAKEMA